MSCDSYYPCLTSTFSSVFEYIYQKDLKKTEYLIEQIRKKPDPLSLYELKKYGNTLLYSLIDIFDINEIYYLLVNLINCNYCNPKTRSEYGRSCLHLVLLKLIAAEYSGNYESSKKYYDIAKIMLKKYITLLIQEDCDGEIPLHYLARFSKNISFIKKFINDWHQCGFKNHKNKDGKTPYDIVCERSDIWRYDVEYDIYIQDLFKPEDEKEDKVICDISYHENFRGFNPADVVQNCHDERKIINAIHEEIQFTFGTIIDI